MIRRPFRKYLPLICLFLATACTKAGLTAANLPTRFSDMDIRRDIDFGGQALDLYIPAHVSTQKLPVIVFFYGGRWRSGQKGDYAFAAHALAARGFIVAVPDYRKYPNVKFPAFVEDGARAVAWTHDHIGAYGGDAEQLFIAGHSAGAHIGALIAADQRYLEAQGKDLSIVKGFAGLAGPYDFTPEDGDLKDMFGPPDNYPNMQVTNFIEGDEPPMLLLYGADDDTVAPYNLERLQTRILEKGGIVESKIYPGIDHISIIAALSWIGRGKAPVAEDVAAFFSAPPHR